MAWRQRTKPGQSYFSSMTYLQKSIREGKSDSALYWAYENSVRENVFRLKRLKSKST